MAIGQKHPLAGTDWEALLARLSVYAVSLYRADQLMLGTGTSPEDLAVTAIEQLLEGKISYDGRRPLLPLLKKALYHDFLDLKKSGPHCTTLILEVAEDATGATTGGLDSLPTSEEPSVDILFRETVYRAIGDDQDLRDFACAVLELGASKPSDIAAVIGTSVEDVENRRKRLRRALAPVRARLGA